MKFFLSFFSMFFLLACSTPDETKPMHEVTCRYWLQQCHLRARQRCNRGHTVSRTIRTDKLGGPQGAYKEFRMIFTCD